MCEHRNGLNDCTAKAWLHGCEVTQLGFAEVAHCA